MGNHQVRIIRADHGEQPYFLMLRATAQNRELSWEARGLLVYLLSKPDDWQVRIDDLRQGCGRDKVYSMLAELETQRYLERQEKQVTRGRRYDYLLHESPLPEIPHATFSLAENTEHTYYREEEHNTELEQEESAQATPSASVEPAAPTQHSKKRSEPKEKGSGEKEKPPAPIGPVPAQAHVALIDAYHYAIPERLRPPGLPAYSRHARVARDLIKEGLCPADIWRFVSETYGTYEEWAIRNDKPALMSLEHVKTYIKAWLDKLLQAEQEQESNEFNQGLDAAEQFARAGRATAQLLANRTGGFGDGTFRPPPRTMP